MIRVLNIAHRGFTRNYPDNTLEAFTAAIDLGTDGIECDVQETSDNNFVIFHDNTIDNRRITEMSLTDIRRVKIRGQYLIPTLEETLRLCHGNVLLNLELKQVHSLDLFLKMVRSVMNPDELLISSFHSSLITKLTELAPDIRRGILTGIKTKDTMDLIRLTGAQVILPMFATATIALVDKLHSRNLSIIIWNCNTPDDMRTAFNLNVDGIITDNPDLFLPESSA